MNTYLEKLRSINIGLASRRQPKKTVDVHDHGTVEITEHWDDRQDINVKPDTLQIKTTVSQ